MKLAEYHHIREGNAEKTKSVSELVDFMDADCRLLWPFLLEAVNNV